MEVLAGVAGRYGLFAATYGIAGVHFSQPHMQVVVIGEGEGGEPLYRAAVEPFSVSKAVLKLPWQQAVAQNLPPALAETIPQPADGQGRKGRSDSVFGILVPATDLCSGRVVRGTAATAPLTIKNPKNEAGDL